MEGMECLSLTEDGLDDDPVFSYTLSQLCHHEVAQTFLGNPPSDDNERQIWSPWHQNLEFHVDASHYAGHEA
jgi:hypothetical protein